VPCPELDCAEGAQDDACKTESPIPVKPVEQYNTTTMSLSTYMLCDSQVI
jgi:hypothetical protein